MKTRGQMLEEVKQTMPEDYDELQKSAFLAVYVSKQVSFDEHYWWGNMQERENIYKMSKKEAINAKPKNKVHRKLICVTITQLYYYLAENIGLNVKYYANLYGDKKLFKSDKVLKMLYDLKHIAVAVKIPDRGYIKVDIQRDVHSIQTHCRPEFFGTRDWKDEETIRLEASEIDEVFKSINYVEDKYTDDYVAEVLKQNQELPLVQKCKILFSDERILQEVKNTKCVEAALFYKFIIEKACKEEINGLYDSKLNFFICQKKMERKKQYTFGLYSIEKDSDMIYIFSKKKNELIPITPTEMQFLLDNGIEVKDMDEKEEFLSYISQNTNNQNDNQSNIADDIMYEDEQEI